MMAKKFLAGALIIVMTAFLLIGCGGNDPRALAKQTYDLSIEALGALFNPSKTAEIEKKMTDIEKKVAKLSVSNQRIYQTELQRLSATSLGGLFGAAGGLLESAAKATESILTEEAVTQDIQNLLNTTTGLLNAATSLSADVTAQSVQDAQNILNATTGLLNTATSLSNDVSIQDAQNALNAAQSAASAAQSAANAANAASAAQSAQSAANAAQSAANAAQSATSALRALGF